MKCTFYTTLRLISVKEEKNVNIDVKGDIAFKKNKLYFICFTPVPGSAESIQTGPGNLSLLLLPTVSAKEAPLPGQLFFS